MKLIQLTNRYYILAFTIAFGVVAIVSYYIIRHVIDKEFNEKLHAEKQQFIDEFEAFDDLDRILYLNIGDEINIRAVERSDPKGELISDTTKFDTYENKLLDYRKLSFTARYNNQDYRVTIVKSLVNNDDLLEAIGEIMILVTGLFLMSLVVINLLLAKKIWSPFYETLSLFRKFNIKQPEKITLPPSKVLEFAILNQAVQEMTDQSAKDYRNLKEYTENSSHEIQTPLAIIQNRTELIMQSLKDEELIPHLSAIRSASIRLSKLKEGLALFTKIDNHQFIETQPIDLNSYLSDLIDNVYELIELKEINYSKKVIYKSTLHLNETLAYVLFNNLISNAIKYNITGGTLDLMIASHRIKLSNSGMSPDIDPNTLFDRFVVSERRKESTGLGLSLVKRIADYYGIAVSYTYEGNKHVIELDWA